MWNCYCDFWKKGFDFSSKSSRRQFWYPFIINFLIAFLFTITGYPWFVNGLRAYQKGVKGSMAPTLVGSTLLILAISYGLISMVPRYAIIARRLRDTQFSLDFEWIYLVVKILAYVLLIGSPVLSLVMNGTIIAIWIAIIVSIDGLCALVMFWAMTRPTGYHQISFLNHWRKKSR